MLEEAIFLLKICLLETLYCMSYIIVKKNVFFFMFKVLHYPPLDQYYFRKLVFMACTPKTVYYFLFFSSMSKKYDSTISGSSVFTESQNRTLKSENDLSLTKNPLRKQLDLIDFSRFDKYLYRRTLRSMTIFEN